MCHVPLACPEACSADRFLKASKTNPCKTMNKNYSSATLRFQFCTIQAPEYGDTISCKSWTCFGTSIA
ncbi:hypothetical protein TcWFU_002731 [Taenia crassiceps]|uniref:Uncharacterized protein n=1 Tax=Taenia crassiceps TaxID=6207 RepID=A0ABR4Q5L5_9CEST